MILRTSRTAGAIRSGFTLLEILLASILAAFVLASVYMLMSVTLRQTQSARDAVEVEDISRGIFNKMSIDLSGTLTPLPPKTGGNSASSGGGSSTSSSGTPSTGTTPSGSGGMPPSTGATAPAATAAPATGTPATTPSSGTTDPAMPGATDNATASASDYAFQAGVIGEEKKLVIYAGRVPEAFSRYGEPYLGSGQYRADQRQIIYWVGSKGLYRRERPWVTADDVRMEAIDDEQATDSALLSEEVTDVTFEYSDGTSWASSWDGTQPGPDGVTPLGPPRAIRVTLTMSIPVSRGEPLTKTVQHVIAVRSAPGPYTPPLLEAPTDGGDNPTADPSGTTGGTTGGATGGGASSGGTTGGNTSGGAKTGGSTGGSTGGAKTGGSTGGAKTGGSTGGTKTGGSTGGTGGAKTGGSSTPSLPSGGTGGKTSGSSMPAPTGGTGGRSTGGGTGGGTSGSGTGGTGGRTGGGR